jgi:hypothetical protein
MPAHLHRLEGAQTEWKAAWWSVPVLLYALFFLLYALFVVAEQDCGFCKCVLRTAFLCTLILSVTTSLWNIAEAAVHQQTGVLLFNIIFISLNYTYYDTIIYHYDTIISLIFLQRSRLLFFIISLSQKGLLFHLWQFYYFTYFININYCYHHTIIWIIFTSNWYYDYFPFRRLLLHLFLYVYIILIIAIITLLFALFVYQAIVTISFFETYCFNY